MPRRRILYCLLLASRTVIVSPSLTPTTLPVMGCCCALADRHRSAESKAATTDCLTLPVLSSSSVISLRLFLLRRLLLHLLQGGRLLCVLHGGLLLASMRRFFAVDFLEPFD